MCFPSALGDAALAPANAPTPDPGGQPGLRGAGGGFVALSGAVRLASKWTAVSAGRSGRLIEDIDVIQFADPEPTYAAHLNHGRNDCLQAN